MRYSNVYIESFGYELAPNVVTSEDLESRLEPLYKAIRIQKGQLEAMTGIYERRFWDRGYKMSQGAAAAGEKALEASNIDRNEIGMLIFGGVCRDNLEPATACAVAEALGLGPDTLIYDVSNACLGVLNGMIQAAGAIESGEIKAGLIVSCESARDIVEKTIDMMIADGGMTLFKDSIATLTGGSGAVAVLMTHGSLSDSGHRLEGYAAKNANRFHRLCLWGPDAGAPVDGTHTMKTDSVAVLKNGVTLGLATYETFMNEMGWPGDKPDKVVCHQVGSVHQKHILEALNISGEKDFSTFRHLGNIGTVSLPITAAIADEREFLVRGDKVGFFGIGSGLNCMMLGIDW